MKTMMLLLVLAIAPATHDVTGTWNMGLQGDHVIPTPLVLKQDGREVTGTIGMPTQQIGHRIEVKLTGEMVDGALKLAGSVESADGALPIEIAGKLQDDGSLEGTLVMRGHNLTWTAERLKERK